MADSPAYHYCHGIPPGEASSSLQRSASDAFESSSELEYPSKRRLTIGSSTDVPLAVSAPTPQAEVPGRCPALALEEIEKRTQVAQLESKHATESNEPGVRNPTISPVEERAIPESSNPTPVFGPDSTAPQLTEDADQKIKMARDILNGIPRRIDPARIKMKETQTGIQGGQGVVVIGILSLDEALNDGLSELKVAVKKLEWKRDDVEESARFFKSFVHELSLMESLSHPNIVMLVGFVEDMQKGDAWMILPWEENGNVREFLQSGEWEIPERISLIKDTAKGLGYLHSRQPPVCHGDLKSFNILVNSSYHAVITDFGSARIRRHLAQEKTDNASGTPVRDDAAATPISPKVQFNASTMELTLTGPKFSLRWTAPEVLNNGVQDLPSDMWALGWVSWEIVTGKIPFDGLNLEREIVVHTIKGKLPAIRQDINLSLVLMLCSVMSDCWLSEPAKRIDASTFQLKVDLMPSVAPSGYHPSGQKVRSAHLLLELGKTYDLQENRVMAESHFRSALDVASRTKDHYTEVNALEHLGGVLRNQSRYLEAEKAFTEARDICSRIGSDLGMANALEGLGTIYKAQSRNSEAEKAFTEAHDIHSRIGHDLGAANALNDLGTVYRAQSRYREAEVAFTETHEIHSRIGNDLGAAYALGGLGEIYRHQSRNSEAEKAFTEAHGIHCRIGSDMGAAIALRGLGNIYRTQSRYREAEKAFTEAHDIHSRIGDEMDAANDLGDLGQVYREESRNSEAEKAFTEVHEIHSRLGHEQGTANALLGLGNTYRAQSRTSEAEMAFNNAYNIYSRIGHVLGTGNALRSLAWLHSDQFRYDDAETCYRLAAASYDHAEAGYSKAQTLLDLGKDLHTRRRYPEAEDAATEALAIQISIGNEEGQADASSFLAKIFRSQSRSDEEKEALLQAEAAYARIGDDAERGATLGRLGTAHLMQGTYDEAEECYRLAQAIFSSTDDGDGEARELHNLGTLYLVQGRHDEAEECYADARVAYARILDVEGQAKALDGLMTVRVQQRKFVDAKAACVEARETYAQMGRPISETCATIWELLQHPEQFIGLRVTGPFPQASRDCPPFVMREVLIGSYVETSFNG